MLLPCLRFPYHVSDSVQMSSLSLARESSAVKLLSQGEMTGDELNELNEGLPWWVKKKIIDAQNRRREPHPAPPPPPAPPRYPCSIAEPQSPRNVSTGFVGEKAPRVKPVGSWMKSNILFCQEIMM